MAQEGELGAEITEFSLVLPRVDLLQGRFKYQINGRDECTVKVHLALPFHEPSERAVLANMGWRPNHL